MSRHCACMCEGMCIDIYAHVLFVYVNLCLCAFVHAHACVCMLVPACGMRACVRACVRARNMCCISVIRLLHRLSEAQLTRAAAGRAIFLDYTVISISALPHFVFEADNHGLNHH